MMTNATDFCSVAASAPAECSVFSSFGTRAAEGAMLASQAAACGNGNGLSLGKDIGGGAFGFSEKRLRDDGRCTVQQRGAFVEGGDSYAAHRSFQDCPEAPLRKRVHVCDGEIVIGAQDSSHRNGKTPEDVGLSQRNGKTPVGVEAEASPGIKSSVELNGGKKLSNSEDIEGSSPEGEPMAGPRGGANCLPGGTSEGVEPRNAVEEDEMEFPISNQPSPERVDIRDFPESVLRTGEANPALEESEATDAEDMDVDVSSRINEAVEAVRGLVADEDGAGAALHSLREGAVGDDEMDGSDGVEFFEELDRPLRRGGDGEQAQAATRAAADASSPGDDEQSLRGRESQRGRPNGGQGAVEVIEIEDSDEDEDGEVPVMETNVHESDESSTKGKRPISRRQVGGGGDRRRPGGGFRPSPWSTSGSYSPADDSDSDDCKVVDYYPPREVLVEEEEEEEEEEEAEDEESESLREDDSDSDVEVVGAASQGAIRRKWEEAAMRRRMGRAMRSEGSNANGQQEVAIDLDAEGTESHGLEESVATSTYHGSPDSKDQTETSEARGGPDAFLRQTDFRPKPTFAHGEDVQAAAASSSVPRDTTGPDSNRSEDELEDLQTAAAAVAAANSMEVPAPNKFSVFEADDLRSQPSDLANGGVHGTEEDANAGTRSNSADWESSPGGDPGINGRSHLASGDTGSDQQRESASADATADEEGASTPPDVEDLLAAKDKLKQTSHYKDSDAAEWDSRQKEIQRQAAETRKLRQRKRQEADRKKEMERKQKERIEELRLSQMKEERNMDIREQLRGQIRERLEKIASTCHDYATLLRQLGVAVDGGRYPTQQQVNVAYKKALMKFHPDRATSSVKGDPRQQVEAEEKFKLILRLKDTLAPAPVANDFMNNMNWRYA